MANQNTNQNQNNNKKKEILKIVVDEHEKFDNLVDSMYSTTQVLSKSINKLMSSVFEDYYGCVINPNMQNPAALDVALYFKPVMSESGDDRYRAFKPIGEKSSNNDSLMTKLAAIQNRMNTSDTFAMTQEAAELLNEFYPAWYNIKATPESYKKANAICEVADRQGFNMVPLCRVAGMDIIRLVSKIYGWKNDDNEAVEYSVQPVRPVSGAQPRPGDNSALNWIIAITRISKVQLDKLANEVGFISNNNGLNIYTGI